MIKVAVIGAENVGKSTFVNVILGKRVSEASETPGTTKGVVKGYMGRMSAPKYVKNPVGGVDDFVIVDTAGLFNPEHELRGRVLSEERFKRILDEIEGCDVVVHMVDAQHGLHRGMEKLHHVLKFRYGKPIVVVINKVDLVDRTRAMELTDVVRKRLDTKPILMSLLTGEGVDRAIEEILKVAGYVSSARAYNRT